MLKLQRLSQQPILTPVREHEWEREAVFNAGAIYENGLFWLFYRASNNRFRLDSPTPRPEEKFVSSIGLAVSTDGIHFSRFDRPVFAPATEQEAWGVEDPRITRIGDIYYMCYTAFGGRHWQDFRPALAWSRNLFEWHGREILLDEPNKDVALFPGKVNGRYVLLHRREPSIWIAFSDDLKSWTDHRILMEPIPGGWEAKKIGAAGPPHRTEAGWVLFYHAVDSDNVYRLGVALLDLADPTRVLARYPHPILEPETDWERNGLVPNVVFSCGSVEKDGAYFVYYGGGDCCLGVAAVDRTVLLHHLTPCR
ncbi:glycosidase [Symbiobacterium thermophilum]|uniref:Glycosidase n=1 Tax=Symbiobacterium thermophilum TaxID=2734 RepID=A0A953I093_SYMTR|nr:glycosidase [Symbiobacterium thermophilum]MBY6275175.1 glycosidase [Symbiobacterium thermophilum]